MFQKIIQMSQYTGQSKLLANLKARFTNIINKGRVRIQLYVEELYLHNSSNS